MSTLGMCWMDVSVELGGARTLSPVLSEGKDDSESVVAIAGLGVMSCKLSRVEECLLRRAVKGVWWSWRGPYKKRVSKKGEEEAERLTRGRRGGRCRVSGSGRRRK